MPARDGEKGLAKAYRPGERLLKFIQPLDYKPHCSSKWAPQYGQEEPECVWSDYMALEVMVKTMGSQVVFSLILPVRGKGLGRS